MLSDEQRAAFARARGNLAGIVARQGVRDPAVVTAIRNVPRHEFVPESLWRHAYADGPLPIGYQQTVSQPYVVALMTDLLRVTRGDRVLEVGTGCGYQTAVLAELGVEVFTIEIVEPLGLAAAERLDRLGYSNLVHARIGDGYAGWPSEAPFDGIIITAAPPRIPEPLCLQLRVGGRMIVPVGVGSQRLTVITRTADGFLEEHGAAVRFVPMIGEVQRPPR